MDRRFIKMVLVLWIIWIVVLGVVIITGIIMWQRLEKDMEALADEYSACLVAPERQSDCFLEYDGDGSHAYPADWSWYWY